MLNQQSHVVVNIQEYTTRDRLTKSYSITHASSYIRVYGDIEFVEVHHFKM